MSTASAEGVEEFGRRARAWISANMPRASDVPPSEPSGQRLARAQDLQAGIYDAGLAAITWPRQYGGLELTPAHMRAFADELRGYFNPYRLLSVSLGVIGPTLLEHGTAHQKDTYLPPLLRGDTLWVQYLSEPTGGSDMAGVLTRADRDGDAWTLNGSKVWTTFGDAADYGLCLVRSRWDVPKHAGLSMFIVPVEAPGVTVLPLAQASGASEFCQESLVDVRLDDGHLLGAEGDGWRVASELLVHERNALGGGSVYFDAGSESSDHAAGGGLVELADRHGLSADPVSRQRVAEVHALSVVGEQLAGRVATGMRTGAFAGPAGSLLKLFSAELHLRRSRASIELAGAVATAWEPDDDQSQAHAMTWLTRQGTSIMGGTNEIQRNIISERVLGLPRESEPGKGQPFNQIRTNAQ